MSRTFIPPQSRGLGAPPGCDPYYEQRHLPLVAPGPVGTPGATGALSSDLRERFHSFASIVTPAANNLNQLIVGFTVPASSQAAIVGIACFYVGTGFVEGDSTLLFFSLRLNGAGFIRDYQTIPNTLGGLANGPWPVPGKIKLNAGDLVEFLVSVPAGSTITTGGTTRCHAHMLGYYWPSGA